MSSLVTRFARSELGRRRGAQEKVALIEGLLSPQQLEFINHPSKFKLARCGRRAGKSYGAIAYMIRECASVPDTPCLFLGLTRESAMNAVWKPMLAMLRLVDIGYEAHQSRGAVSFSNGSKIQIFGADASGAIDRIRGTMFKLIIADEMGFIKDNSADSLIESLIPALTDLNGTLCMLSSPGYVLDGLFYQCDQGNRAKNWHRVHWDLRSNPYFQVPANDKKYASRAEEALDTIVKAQYGGNWNHPAFRREFLGEWVADASSLVYPANEKTKISVAPDFDEPQHAIGIDLGSVSASAIVVLRYSHYSRNVCVVDTFKKTGMLVDELAAVLKTYIDKYKPTTIVADTGGLGKVPVEEFRRRYHMPILSADKVDKSFYSSVVANDLLSGYIQVIEVCSDLLSEWAKITKDTTGAEIKGQENHLADSFLYVYRRIYNSFLKTYEPRVTEEDRMIAALEKNAQNEMDENRDLYEDLQEMQYE